MIQTNEKIKEYEKDLVKQEEQLVDEKKKRDGMILNKTIELEEMHKKKKLIELSTAEKRRHLALSNEDIKKQLEKIKTMERNIAFCKIEIGYLKRKFRIETGSTEIETELKRIADVLERIKSYGLARWY